MCTGCWVDVYGILISGRLYTLSDPEKKYPQTLNNAGGNYEAGYQHFFLLEKIYNTLIYNGINFFYCTCQDCNTINNNNKFYKNIK